MNELRRIRWRLDMTQVEFARELGIISNSLARLERGERLIRPTMSKLVRMIEREYGLRKKAPG
jgi:predicted transcriptional regulator